MILPFVEQAIRPLEESPGFQAALRALERSAPGEVTLAGLTDTAKVLATALMARALGRPLFFVAASNRRAEALLEPLRFFYGVLTGRPESAVAFLPSHDVSPYRGLSTHPEIAAERAQALWRLANGEAELALVALPAALGRLASREQYAALGRTVQAGATLEREEFIAYLEGAGYERREPVEMPGEFSVRGGIVDIFPVEGRPLRLEFFGDALEELRQFDPATQRSTAPLTAATLV
ncbi:MAG: transcription-repair coupling factor, partial [Candidatus Acidiferrales bacterium]